MQRSRFITTVIATALVTLGMLPMHASHADSALVLDAGAGSWEQEYSGHITSGSSTVDVEHDMALDEERNSVFYISLEHGLPGLPNIRANHMSVGVDGSSVLSRTIEFNGDVFALADAIDTVVEMDQTDAVLYYQLLDNTLSLDLGMALSYIVGSVEVTNSYQRGYARFDEIVPMLYIKARTDLPMTGFWAGAQAQGIRYADNSLREITAHVGWMSDIGLGVEAGYRSVHMEIGAFDDVQSAELEINGPYAAFNYRF